MRARTARRTGLRPRALVVRLLLGGYAPGPWRRAEVLSAALGLLWLAGGGALALVQMLTRTESLNPGGFARTRAGIGSAELASDPR